MRLTPNFAAAIMPSLPAGRKRSMADRGDHRVEMSTLAC
jgi:hypothetical protein